MKTEIEIKDISGNVLFSHECEDNSVKKTLEEAVRQHVRLRGANLRDANLGGANLHGANLRGAYLGDVKNIPFIPLACPSDGMRANFTMESLKRHQKKNAENSNLAEQFAHMFSGEPCVPFTHNRIEYVKVNILSFVNKGGVFKNLSE